LDFITNNLRLKIKQGFNTKESQIDAIFISLANQ